MSNLLTATAVTLLLVAPVPAALLHTDGRATSLDAYRGKPAVVFYEDRHSTAVNQALKQELFARGRESGLLDAAHVVAVANIRAYDFFPARDIALEFIRRLEPRIGIPILVDVDGTLSAAPWRLPPDGASVALVDANGAMVAREAGRLDAAAREAFLVRLRALVGNPGTR